MGDQQRQKMENFVNAMMQTTKNENWYASLFIALSLPDICGKIDTPAEGPGPRYKAWFNTYINDELRANLSGTDCYALRCALLHQGVDDTATQRASEVVTRFEFNVLTSMLTYHNVMSECGSKLQLNVGDFCKDIRDAVTKWLDAIEDDPDKQERLGSLLQIRDFNAEDPFGGQTNWKIK